MKIISVASYWKWPKDFNHTYNYASHINPEIAKTIKENGKARTGWLIVDYAGYLNVPGYDDIVSEIIDSNRTKDSIMILRQVYENR
ncbi:hypothetical protein ACVPOS_02805 [Staphylococcus aureus]